MREEYEDDSRFGDLFAGVPPRQRPDTAVTRRLERELHGEWRQLVRLRRRRTGLRALAAVAAFAAVGLVTWRALVETPVIDVPVATIERATGDAIRWHTRSREVLPAMGADAVVETGRSVTTGEGARLALRWHRRGSLRVDERSQVEFADERGVRLVTGSVYYDSDGSPPEALTIHTPVGEITHRGTQYLARFDGGRLHIAVREGVVSVEDGGRSHRIGAGERVIIDAFGAQSRETVSSYDPLWDWAQEVAPSTPADGASVEAVLRWVARESGRRIVYASAATERAAVGTRVSGLAGIEPAGALEAMGLMTDLTFTTRDGAIVVETRQ